MRCLLLVLLWLAPAAWACPPPPAVPSPPALEAAARQDRGALWALHRDGRTSYLYGTLHVGRPEWQQPGPKVAAALAASDVLALELDPADAGVQREVAAMGAEPAPALPPALKARLARQVERACFDAAAFGALHPAMQALLLSLAEARWAGLDAAFGQEIVLAERARSAGRPVLSLETVALQKQVLVPAEPKALQAMLEQTLGPLESGRARSILARLAEAWAAGDIATLEGYEQWCECVHSDDDRAALAALNDGRNPGLVERIAALHGEGRRVFAAVGALHMTGPQALPRLMAARGFRVERVAFGAQ